MLDIIMLIGGVIILILGKCNVTRGKEVRGWRARLVGLILNLPWPLAFLLGMVLGVVMLGSGSTVEDMKTTLTFVGLAITVTCFIAAIVAALLMAEPVVKKPVLDHDDAVAGSFPGQYRDHFRDRPAPPPAPPDAYTAPEADPRRPADDRVHE